MKSFSFLKALNIQGLLGQLFNLTAVFWIFCTQRYFLVNSIIGFQPVLSTAGRMNLEIISASLSDLLFIVEVLATISGVPYVLNHRNVHISSLKDRLCININLKTKAECIMHIK
ncbi:hypothetical protein [Spartinivicinus poritis]|uniref:Uncharacterized protein n=1 Tax=Spartinivicinus poritis TaxID=2994640 RepID=A0ABT5UG31_9GAMM|nr:hypothetical protein [Spartinivicinus sp. A2-2]MDE1465272.1 hypothetical protein [Spartinivicinus sp. A2-2]